MYLNEWGNLANGDSGNPDSIPNNPDKTVSVSGTFGSGGTVVMEGSNDGVNYYTVKDPQGTLISFTAAGSAAIQENHRFIRPRVTAGDATTDIDIVLVSRGNE